MKSSVNSFLEYLIWPQREFLSFPSNWLKRFSFCQQRFNSKKDVPVHGRAWGFKWGISPEIRDEEVYGAGLVTCGQCHLSSQPRVDHSRLTRFLNKFVCLWNVHLLTWYLFNGKRIIVGLDWHYLCLVQPRRWRSRQQKKLLLLG